MVHGSERSRRFLVARVTPRGDITEFNVCDSCGPNDIVQGPDGILYISENGGQLLRITTSGEVLPEHFAVWSRVLRPDGRRRGGLDEHLVRRLLQQPGRSLQHLRRSGRGPFTFFPAPEVDDVAVAPDGTVWFTGTNSIGEIDPAVGVVSTTALSAEASAITVAPNGTVWVTEPFADLVGRLTPSASGPHGLVEFPTPVDATPLDIAAAPDGNVWFTQNLRGNIARITQAGVVTEASKAIAFTDPKRPDPVGIAIAANGNPWYAESLTDKVVNLKLR